MLLLLEGFGSIDARLIRSRKAIHSAWHFKMCGRQCCAYLAKRKCQRGSSWQACVYVDCTVLLMHVAVTCTCMCTMVLGHMLKWGWQSRHLM